VGSVNADVSYMMPDLPAPGETVLSTLRLDAPGGKGANQAAALAILGIDVEFISAVGDDESGRALLEGLKIAGVGISGVAKIRNQTTGSAVILVGDSGENSIVVHAGANSSLTPEHVRNAVKDMNPRIVISQLEIPLRAVLEASKIEGSTFILNPAPMPKSDMELELILKSVDILVPNRTELASLAGKPLPESLKEVVSCAQSLDFGGQLIVTLGAEGALVFAEGVRGAHKAVSAPKVNAVDTSGAGDAFCAALAAGLAQRLDIIQATARACEFAAWTTTQPGAQVSVGMPIKPEFHFN
jgi:ribokinase